MGALIDRTIEFSARNRAIVLITAGAAVLAHLSYPDDYTGAPIGRPVGAAVGGA